MGFACVHCGRVGSGFDGMAHVDNGAWSGGGRVALGVGCAGKNAHPSGTLGMEPTLVQGEGIEAVWSPRLGSDLGLRIHRRLKDGWTVGGGLEWIRREHDIVVAYSNDSLGWTALDTLPGMRSLAYRIPFLGGIRIPMGWKDLECNRALGSPWSGRQVRPL